MNSKGIFDSGSSDTADQSAPNPFGVVSDDSADAPPNPFAAASPHPSPFAIAGDSDTPDRAPLEPGQPARIPEKRLQPPEASPFSLAEPSEGFGYEPSSPFGGGASFESATSPFAAAPVEQAPAPEAPAPAPAQRSEPVAPTPVAAPAPVAPPADPAPAIESAPQPAWSEASTAAAVAAPASVVGGAQPEIRQLELRAIFGVDRELSSDEIVQRLRGLAGVRHAVRVGSEEIGAMDMLRRSLSGMAGENTPLKLSIGGAPVDFIREGKAVLAVMTDGSFAPGVRETMIIAARELNRMT